MNTALLLLILSCQSGLGLQWRLPLRKPQQTVLPQRSSISPLKDLKEYVESPATKPKSKEPSSIARYSDEPFPTNQWNISLQSSFNSTTLRYLFQIQEEIVSFWTKLEQKWISWTMQVSSKVERDISTTAKTTDYIVRKIDKEANNIMSAMAGITRYYEQLFAGVMNRIHSHFRPVLALPSTLSSMTNSSKTFGLALGSKVNPFQKTQLLGNLDATTTKDRAKRRITAKVQHAMTDT